MKWRAYYADGQRIDSSESSWADLPPEGLAGVLVFKEKPYRHIIDGHDWIWMADGELHIVDTHDEWGQWADPPQLNCNSCLKKGIGMGDADFQAMQTEMVEDNQWPS